MRRSISASADIATRMKLLKKKRIDIYSFFPIDKGDCVCAKLVSDWQDKLRMMPQEKKDAEIEKLGHFICPRDKTGMTRYVITCNNCNEIMGYCWATDATLDDFCDFHYVSWTDGNEWFGCFTPNISPITQQLTIECTCGQDTRDFRANQTLPGKRIEQLEREAKIGREFNKPDSKFAVVLAK